MQLVGTSKEKRKGPAAEIKGNQTASTIREYNAINPYAGLVYMYIVAQNNELSTFLWHTNYFRLKQKYKNKLQRWQNVLSNISV